MGRKKESNGPAVIRNPVLKTKETPMSEEKDRMIIEVPDIPMPEGGEDTSIVKDECEGAFKFAFIGVGQGGSRIAESFWKLGYRRVCCVNTTSLDLAAIAIPDANKLVMDIGTGGAGKEPGKGAQAVKAHYEDVYDLMRRSFGREFDRIFVCLGAGGGTGSGACNPIIEIAHDIAQALKVETADGPPAVGAIVSLPKVSEGSKVNLNACEVLESLFRQVGEDRGKLAGRTLSPLILVDNDRINKIYPNVPVTNFWTVANQSISTLFHLFNSIATKDSDFTTFDKADLKDLLDSGVVSFGACPIVKWDQLTDISYAIRDNLRKNVLVGNFNLNQARSAGCIFIGNQDVLAKIPQENLEHGFEMLTRIMRENSVVHRGIYKGNKPGLVVYSILGELGRPTERMEEIAKTGGATIKR
jgi:cell division GTPase FtsZ